MCELITSVCQIIWQRKKVTKQNRDSVYQQLNFCGSYILSILGDG